MDQILIKDLVARGIIGVNDLEREKPQEILINIVLFADLRKVGITDNLDDTVNYRTIAKRALAHAESAKRCPGACGECKALYGRGPGSRHCSPVPGGHWSTKSPRSG